MGDRRIEERRKGERRVEDRRKPEKAIIKLSIRDAFLIGIIIIIITTLFITSIYYIKNKNIDENVSYYEDDDDEEYIEQYTCDLIVEGDKTEIKAGEDITFELLATNIDAEDGIIMFETLLDYDTDVFECEVVEDDDSEWSKTSLIENYLTMTRNDLLPNSQNQSITKIKFKAKEDVKASNQIINLSNIKFTMDNEESFEIDDQVINIDIVE